jgi:hypothetical protein
VGVIWDVICSGHQTSGAYPTSKPKKPGGATPTMVKGKSSRNLPAYHTRVQAKPILPVLIADDGYWLRPGRVVIAFQQRSSNDGLYSQHRVEVASNANALCCLGLSASLWVTHPHPIHAAGRDDIAEGMIGLLISLNQRIAITVIRSLRLDRSKTTSCCGSLTGSLFSSVAFSRLKIAVFAPMPSASESTATAVKALCFHSIRIP